MSTVRANSILDSSGGNTAQINGMTPTAQSLQGFRNRFINGSMAVWQRGTSGFANGAYCADRWLGLNITTVAQSSDTPSAAFPFSIDFANTAASFPLVMQRIESVNSADLVGQQVTLSFWAKNVSGSSNLFCELFYPNAKDNFASSTFIQSFVASASPSSSWTFYSGTFNALPSQVANGLEVRIVRNNASASQTRITGVQLEAGSVATPFERRDYGRELMMCQRYYYKTFAQTTAPAKGVTANMAFVVGNSGPFGNNLYGSHSFKTEMRAAPSVTFFNPQNAAAADNSARGFWADRGTGTGQGDYNMVLEQANTHGWNGYLQGTGVIGSGWYQVHYTASAEL